MSQRKLPPHARPAEPPAVLQSAWLKSLCKYLAWAPEDSMYGGVTNAEALTCLGMLVGFTPSDMALVAQKPTLPEHIKANAGKMVMPDLEEDTKQ